MKENSALGHAFKQKSSWYVIWPCRDIMLYCCVVSILCVHVSLGIILVIPLYLETYTHERWYISIWYLISLVSTFLLLFDYLVAPGKTLAMSACLMLFYLFALIFGWSQALIFTFILLSLWTYVLLFWYIPSIGILWILSVGMSW